MKKVGIITFHNSYNCGSMMESYAIHKFLLQKNIQNEIINFSNSKQKELYSAFYKGCNIKNIVKNFLLLPFAQKISHNNHQYEKFKNTNYILSKKYNNSTEIPSDAYDMVIAGSDQIWNITIADSDDAYFLNWADKNTKKIAYAPSFGSKNIQKYSKNPNHYKELINDFDALSVREKNGLTWIKDLTGRDAELLIDPTLLFNHEEYDKILDNKNTPKNNYIFFYCPSFDIEICKYVKKISKKYKLPVIAWSTKSYYTKLVWRYGFKLPKYESPSVYLSLIKNAKLIFTTSFHGTIFSTIYRKNFFTIKNGGMYGDDDRVKTLIEQLHIEDRLIPYTFDENFNYLAPVDYTEYEKELPKLQQKANNYINKHIVEEYEKTK